MGDTGQGLEPGVLSVSCGLCRAQVNIYLPSICFSIFMSIAFLPFEVPNHHPQHLLLSLSGAAI